MREDESMGGRHRAHEWTLRDWLLIGVALVIGLVAAGLTQDAASPTGSFQGGVGLARTIQPAAAQVVPLAPAGSSVVIVQALPGDPVNVEVDGRTVGSDVAVGKVIGPLDLAPGNHEVSFVAAQGGPSSSASVTVNAGTAHDVVLHATADPAADPMVSTFKTPTAMIAAGKARVQLAHTAEVGAGDIWVDGQPAFKNITNGQFATADVPAGMHKVAIRPAGQTGTPILGPVDVDLAEGTVTLAYAVGNPADDSMTVVAHVLRLKADGSVTPLRIGTGSAGLAAEVDVRGFGP